MVNQDSSIAPGFTLYFSEKHNQRFLLPIATVAQLAAQADLASQAAATEEAARAAADRIVMKTTFVGSKPRPQHDNILSLCQVSRGTQFSPVMGIENSPPCSCFSLFRADEASLEFFL
jgi:hypothetical protein